MVAAACREREADRGEAEGESPRMVDSPLPFVGVVEVVEAVMVRSGTATSDDGGNEFRSGAMALAFWSVWSASCNDIGG
jgi:hypothetical protein